MATSPEVLLSIENLSVFFHGSETVRAVRNLNLRLRPGEICGLVGESGCGKSVTALSVMGLLEEPGRIESGRVVFDGRELTTLSRDELDAVRGNDMAMIFQEPMTALNPVFTIGYQIMEILKIHGGMGAKEAEKRAAELLNRVGIPSPERRLSSYPHELSGGMRQRVMIAMSLAPSPKLLIADEPTTALDVTTQAQILDLLARLCREEDMALLLITHDLGVVAQYADAVGIMYAGELVEYALADDLYSTQRHPYTRGLFASIPPLDHRPERLFTIPGTVPVISKEPTGCVFAERCVDAIDECRSAPVPLEEKASSHLVRCIRA